MVTIGAGCATQAPKRVDEPPQKNLSYSPEDLGQLGNGVAVVVNSRRNEVLLPGGRKWTGRLRGTRDVMLIGKGQIVSASEVPEALHPTYDVQVDFRQESIRYFFFRTKQSGSYERRQPR